MTKLRTFLFKLIFSYFKQAAALMEILKFTWFSQVIKMFQLKKVLSNFLIKVKKKERKKTQGGFLNIVQNNIIGEAACKHSKFIFESSQQ